MSDDGSKKGAIVSDEMAKKFATEKETPYIRWVRDQGLDIIDSVYVQSLYTVELKPWARREGQGVYLNHDASRTTNDCYVCEIAPGKKLSSRCVETKVRFKRLSREDLDSYIASNEWRGKAGGYAIQGRAEAFVRLLAGSHSAVIGLPLYETVHLLEGAGYPVFHSWMTAPQSEV